MKLKNILGIITNVLLIALGATPIVLTIVQTNDFNFVSLATNLSYLTFCLLTLISLWGVIVNIVSLAKNKELHTPVFFSFVLAITVLSTLNAGLLAFNFVLDLYTITSIVIPVCLVTLLLTLNTNSKKHSFVVTITSLILPLAYFGTIIGLSEANVITTPLPYEFMDVVVDNNLVVVNLLMSVGFAIAPFVLAILLWLASNGVAKSLAKEEEQLASQEETAQVEVEETKEETSSTVLVMEESSKKADSTKKKAATSKSSASTTPNKEPVKKEVAKKEPVKKAAAPATTNKETTKKSSTTPVSKPSETKISTDPGYRIYHITKRTDVNMWQVKYAKGVKAIKLFRTQQEAIDFAKDLASRNGASIRLHGVNGKIRKI